MALDDRSKVGRAYDLDWVRAGAMAAVFLFHCARPFDSDGWHIKNAETTLGFSIFSTLLVQWMMPTFFLVSGWVTFLILRRVTPGSFVVSRVKRLLVPFVFGTLVLVPHQVYIERVTQSGVGESFVAWFPQYFDGFYAFGGNFAWMGLHLWYLGMLFLYSLLLLPVFLLARRPSEGGAVPLAVIVLGGALPLLAVELIVGLSPETVGRRDFGGWSFVTYVVWFLLGYLIGRDVRFQQGLVRARHASLVMTLISVTLGFAIVFREDVDFGYVGNLVVRVAVAWGGVAAVLGYAARHLNRDASWRRSINEGILPFYILHQSVIVLVAYFVLRWEMAPVAKFAIIVLMSLPIILSVYCFVIRPIEPLRFLFGLPVRPETGRPGRPVSA